MRTMPAIGPLSKRPSIAASATGWWRATSLAWRSPVGNADHQAGDGAGDDAHAEEPRRLIHVQPLQRVVGADRRHHECTRDDGRDHRVRVLRQRPRTEQEGAQS